jgi:nucleoside-diphosphate-sugar epimerase
MSGAIFLTGGTGFLGMELLARLLEGGDGPDVFVAVRAHDRPGARARVDQMLEKLYDERPASAERLRPVRSDLTGVDFLQPGDRRQIEREVDRVVHCAASISWDLPLDAARAINVEGTRRVAELAQRLDRLERFVHVSTAYVAGRSPGAFGEEDLDRGQRFRNTYEQTKWEAEKLLTSIPGLPLAIVRPSIVVGESDSGWTPAFNVVYWPMQAFARGLLHEVPADPDGVVDLVPVDYVIDLLHRATWAPGVGGTFNAVAGKRAFSVRQMIDHSCRLFEREPPVLTEPGTFDPGHPAAMFAPYFDVETRFDDSRTQTGLASSPPDPAGYLHRLIAYAKRSRWGKSPLTRESARRVALAEA